MGSTLYWYIVKYQENIAGALEELREREFRAGRYYPVTFLLEFPVTRDSPCPGARHASIIDAVRSASTIGTRSILDIDHISTYPESGGASPLAIDVLYELFGTSKPSREMIAENLYNFEFIDRGQSVYIILFNNKFPVEILFIGYSVD